MIFGLLIVISVVYAITVAAEGVVMLHAHFFEGDWDEVPDLRSFGRQVLFAVTNMACIYSVYRNLWRRLLVTDGGLFQVLDPTRPWPTDRDIDEPDSRLRAIKIYGWDQFARFHSSRQKDRHILHLSVHQPGISVPQLISYKFPTLSDAEWQQFDDLLRKHVAAAPPSAEKISFNVQHSGDRLLT
jgi:hypothetical protein